MSLKYGILCLLALFAVVLLSFENYEMWTGTKEWPAGRETVKKPEKKPEAPSVSAPPKESSNVKSFVFIASKNVFSPERTDFPVVVPPGGADAKGKPVARPQILLFGITLFGDYQSATVSTPGNPLRKGERETMTLKPGDKVGEYQLSKILPDRVTLEAGEDSFDVLLYDPKSPRQRSYVKTEAKPAAITTIGPTPAPAPTAPGAVPVPQPPPQAVTGQPVPAPGPKPAGPAFAPSPVFPPRPTTPSRPIRRGAGTLIPQ